MPRSSHPRLATLHAEIREGLPRLSASQAHVLGEMADALLMVDGCGMTRMCRSLSALSGQSMHTLRQHYREISDEKEAKAGVKKRQQKRREIVVEEHFADLPGGLLKRWQGEKALVLALDASALSDRLTILSFSVTYRGCAMRVAWTITEGGEAGEWRPHWERMLQLLAEAVPADWTVEVMTDRGLYAAWLFRSIQANGWHPFLRVKKGLGFRGQGEETFTNVGERVKKPGREWKGQGEWSEKGDRMEGTLLVRGEEGYEEPIAVVTDLAPSQAQTAWYHRRFWIECDGTDGKRGWFHWEQSKMLKPERASRFWLVLAVVMPKAILLGGALEVQEEEEYQRRKRKQRGERRPGRPVAPVPKPRGREQSVLLQGMMALRAAEMGSQKSCPDIRVRPEPLPTRRYPVSRVPKSYQLKKQRREEKKRNRARANTRSKRAERAAERVEKRAEVQARKLLRQEQRAAKEAETHTHKRAQSERRALNTAKTPTHQPVQPACSQENVGESHHLLEEPPEETALLPLPTAQKLAAGRREPPEKELPMALVNQTPPLAAPRPVRRVPLLRLSRGCLLPPHRLVREKFPQKGGVRKIARSDQWRWVSTPR